MVGPLGFAMMKMKFTFPILVCQVYKLCAVEKTTKCWILYKNNMKGVKTRPKERNMLLSTGYNDDMIYTMSNYVIHTMYSKAGTYRYCFK